MPSTLRNQIGNTTVACSQHRQIDLSKHVDLLAEDWTNVRGCLP